MVRSWTRESSWTRSPPMKAAPAIPWCKHTGLRKCSLIWEYQGFGLTAEDVSNPRVMMVRLGCGPVIGVDGRHERLTGPVLLARLVLRHGQDKAGTWPHYG